MTIVTVEPTRKEVVTMIEGLYDDIACLHEASEMYTDEQFKARSAELHEEFNYWKEFLEINTFIDDIQ